MITSNNRVVVVFLFLIVSITFSCMQQKRIVNKNALQMGQSDGGIQVNLNDKLLFQYNVDTQFPPDTLPDYYQRSGFIHPVKTLSGNTITDDFPFDHAHQHAIFNAWTKTTFKKTEIDFWNQQDRLGTVRHTGIKSINSEANRPQFNVELEHLAFMESDTIIVLEEEWIIECQLKEGYYTIDFTSIQTAADSNSLYLNKYLYGGLAFRGSAEWNIENNYDSICYFKTNENLNHIDGNHTRPKWASMYGLINGNTSGVTIIQHPSNFRYPQHIRVHSTMPYFCFNPTVEEGFWITQDDKYTSRFRFIIFDGSPVEEIIETEFQEFSLI